MTDALEWLAKRGLEPRGLFSEPSENATQADGPASAAPAVMSGAGSELATVHATQAGRLADAAVADQFLAEAERHATPRIDAPSLADDVARAMGYVRNATANTVMSEGRLRRRLADRDHPPAVIEQALGRARRERLVDDHALARSLVEEGLRKGHAPRRVATDLRKREVDDAAISQALAKLAPQDPEAAAFAIASDRAASLRHLEPEKAFRRLVAYLARRGHGEGMARKVARQVLWTDREADRTAQR